MSIYKPSSQPQSGYELSKDMTIPYIRKHEVSKGVYNVRNAIPQYAPHIVPVETLPNTDNLPSNDVLQVVNSGTGTTLLANAGAEQVTASNDLAVVQPYMSPETLDQQARIEQARRLAEAA